MKTYENNMADQALIVKSIKVLENIEGGGITEIRNDMDAMRKQQSYQSKTQEQYWTALSSDGIVSPVEKQNLLREMENIKRSEAAITAQAATYGYTGLILQDYIATYTDLHDYLYVTLKLFDDMTRETVIEDRDTFNTKFSQYYFEENFVLLAITAGILDTLNLRVLQSLNESGTEGEIAIYHGAIYQYLDGAWKNVTTGAYKGPHDELPVSENDAFFIVSESFTLTDAFYVNDEEFYVNGDILGITRTFIKGMIYYCKDGVWYIEENTKDWKYSAAFADVINITGELPALFQAAIDDLQAQIDQTVTHVPAYLGASSSIPSAQEGDYFVYSGGSTGSWVKSMVYRYTNGSWEQLDPNNTAYRNYYMMALEDILATQVTGEGYFSTIFALAFFANSATLQSLSVRTIYLSNYGTIESDLNTYSPEQTGLRIDAGGNIDANGNTHLGNKVAIGVSLSNPDFGSYSVVIGGNAKITGVVNATDGNFEGTINARSGSFTGTVNATGGRFTGTEEVVGQLNVSGGEYVSGVLDVSGVICKSNTGQIIKKGYPHIYRFNEGLTTALFTVMQDFAYIYGNRGLIPKISSSNYYLEVEGSITIGIYSGSMKSIQLMNNTEEVYWYLFNIIFQSGNEIYSAQFNYYQEVNKNVKLYRMNPRNDFNYNNPNASTYIGEFNTWNMLFSY